MIQQEPLSDAGDCLKRRMSENPRIYHPPGLVLPAPGKNFRLVQQKNTGTEIAFSSGQY
jgi:hypothetical protein